MEVVFLLAAEQELQEAYNWVAEYRRGKEQAFLTEVDSRLEHLKRFSLIGRVYGGDIAGCSFRGTLSVSSMWSNQTGLLSTRSLTFVAVLRS
jgi:hypothetical protein